MSRGRRIPGRRGLVELGRVLHAERLMRSLLVEAVDEVIESGLLLQEIASGGLGGFLAPGGPSEGTPAQPASRIVGSSRSTVIPFPTIAPAVLPPPLS